MKKSLKSGIILAMVILMSNACYYDNEEDLYPAKDEVCDTVAVSFSATILPLLNSECNMCHGTGIAQGSLVLDNYNDVLLYANDGSLLGSVEHQTDYSAMPKGRAKLSACKINKIRAWIAQGALNN